MIDLFAQQALDWVEAAGIYGPLVVVIGILAYAAKQFANWLDTRAQMQAAQFKQDIAELKKQVADLESEVATLKNGHFACRMILIRGLSMFADPDVRKLLNEAIEVLR